MTRWRFALGSCMLGGGGLLSERGGAARHHRQREENLVIRSHLASRSCMPIGTCLALIAVLLALSGVGAGSAAGRQAQPQASGAEAPTRTRVPVDFNALTPLLGAASKTLRPDRAGRAASVITGSMTIGGSPLVVSIPTSGDTAAITFSGSIGQRVSLNVYGMTLSYAFIAVQNPSYPSAPQYLISSNLVVGTQGKFYEPLTLGQNGTYTIVIDPQGNTGNVTLALYDVPADLSGPITPGGSPVVAQTTVAGQNASYSFPATAGQRVSLRADTGSFTSSSGALCCAEFVRIMQGAQTIASSSPIGPNSWDFIDTQTLAAGTYNVVVDPLGDAYGTTTLTLYDVPPDLTAPTLVVNANSETITLGTPGQNAALPFHGENGQTVTLDWSQGTISLTQYKILDPNGNTLQSTGWEPAGHAFFSTTLNATSDSFKVVVNPFADSTGHVALKLTGPAPTSQTYGTCGSRGRHARVASRCLADPVNSLTGAFTTSDTDLTLAANGVQFAYTRSYTSADTTAGRLGPGWTDPYAVSLSIQPNGDALLHGDEGQRLSYTKQPDGSFVGAAGALSTLTAISGGYKLVTSDQVTYTFDSAGVLQSERDRNQQGLSFAYDGSGRLSTITDQAPRTVTLAYNASNLVSSLTSSDGRTVGYGYTNGRLSSVTLPDPDGPGPLASPTLGYSYDAGGRLATITDPNNHAEVTNVYDPTTGRVSQQTDANNKTTTFAWDPATQTATVTDPNNHVWKDVYANNVLIQQIDATNKTTLLTHNASLDLTAVTSPDGTSTTNITYDGAGNPLVATAPSSLGSVQKVFTYDTQNNLRTVTDPRGKQTVLGYDSAGNNNSITLDGQAIAGASYDAQGRILTSTDGNGKITSYSNYDAGGRPKTVTGPDPDGAGPLVSPITTYTYDAMGNVLTRVEPLGNCSGCVPADYRTTFTYDAEGHLLTKTDPLGHVTTHTYDPAGNELTLKDANNHAITFEYDNANHLTKITAPDPDGAGAQTAPITTFTYDDNGNRISQVDPRGNVPGGTPSAFTTSYAYDADNRLISVTTPKGETTSYGYDADGNRTTVVEARGNASGNLPSDYTTTDTYDAAGRLLTSRDPLGNVTTNHYDAGGNLDWTKDANNHQTNYSYDAAGRILTITAPDTGFTTYTYDGNGNLKTRKDDNNHLTTYTYDDEGRLTQISGPDPDGAGPQTAPLTTYSYDLNGNQTSKTDPNGNATPTAGDGKTTYTYDHANQLKTIGYSDTTPAVTFGYDNVGNRTSMADGSGTLNYGYDALDRLTSAARGTNTFSYLYDAAGNVTNRTYPDTTQIAYTYDEDNRLASMSSGGNTTSFAYDQAGNVTQTTLPAGNGFVETRTYDHAGRLTEVKNAKGAIVLSDFVSTLDPVGNPTQVSQTGAISSTTTYSYDNSDRLTGVCFQTGTCPASGDPFIRWTYDKVGNRLSEARPGGATTTYTYNGLDQLTQAGSTAYTYDQNGNEKSAGSRTFTYDLANRLKTTTSGSTTTTYSYDGDGARLQASTGTQASKKTNFLWDTLGELPQIALERDGNNALIRRYLYGVRRVSMRAGTADFYYHYDGIGSVRNVTSATGVTQWTDTYEPFGAIRTETKNVTSAPDNPMKFDGEYADPTGLYHLRARQYDPTNGRFLRVDPAEQAHDDPLGSAYAFVDNRPTTLIDPSGETKVSLAKVAAFAVVSLYGTNRCFMSAQTPMSADRYGNGCGPGGITAKLVPDRVRGSFDFRDACEGHDKCYGQRWGTWRKSCDTTFYRAMVDTCPPLTIGPPCNALFRCPSIPNVREGGCHAAAKIYFEAVRRLGRSAFVKGQMGVIKDCKLGSRDACIKSIERRADL